MTKTETSRQAILRLVLALPDRREIITADEIVEATGFAYSTIARTAARLASIGDISRLPSLNVYSRIS